jgi:hypothetical protein
VAKSKLNKGLLRKAKKAAKEAGNELPSNKKELRNAARQVKQAARENKTDQTSITWNLDVGDLVELKRSTASLGCIVAIESQHAKGIRDYSQYVCVLTKHGVVTMHPRYAKLIQKS